MNFSLEQIDELKRRTNVSYGEAKEALEKSNGDLIEALVYLEKHNKFNPVNAEQKCCAGSKVKSLIEKGNNTRFIIQKDDRTVLNLSVTVSVVATALASYIVIPGLLLGLVTGHKMRFESKEGEGFKVNETLDKISNVVDSAKKKINEEDTLKK